jgi:Mrp family chromosome partitioning ATPase
MSMNEPAAFDLAPGGLARVDDPTPPAEVLEEAAASIANGASMASVARWFNMPESQLRGWIAHAVLRAEDNPTAEKVAKLLNMAERGSTPEEADAFFAKAFQLQAKYALDEAIVQAKRTGSVKPEEIIEKRLALVAGEAEAGVVGEAGPDVAEGLAADLPVAGTEGAPDAETHNGVPQGRSRRQGGPTRFRRRFAQAKNGHRADWAAADLLEPLGNTDADVIAREVPAASAAASVHGAEVEAAKAALGSAEADVDAEVDAAAHAVLKAEDESAVVASEAEAGVVVEAGPGVAVGLVADLPVAGVEVGPNGGRSGATLGADSLSGFVPPLAPERKDIELRAYLGILRRRWKLIAAATLIVAVPVGITSMLRTPMYRASADVLLRPNDPAEQINVNGPVVHLAADADRYLSSQLDIIESKAVAVEAAKDVSGASTKELLEQVDATQSGANDIVRISATDPDPARAVAVANAFAKAYIEKRRRFAVAGLERAAAEIDTKLTELQDRIAQIDQDKAAQEKVAANKKPKPTPEVVTPQGSDAARRAAELQYESLYAKQQTLLVNKSLQKGEAELISEAEIPEAPDSPQPKRDGALGATVGLLLGLGVAFLKEQLDERIRSREAAEAVTGLPVLAELPFDDVISRNVLACQRNPHSPFAEATRGLRTSLMFLGIDQPLRRIVVTSSGSGEGKSTVAANLAITYAQAGKRIILVSADLRRPRVDMLFSVPAGATGLSDVIAGLTDLGLGRPSRNGHGPAPSGTSLEEALTAALQPTSVDGLFVLPAGKLPPNPAELLGSQRAAEVLEALSARADVVVMDTPPLLPVTDAAVLAPRADGVVLVASAGQTHRGALARAASTLAATRAPALGLVFNKVGGRAGSGYGYGYGAYYYGRTESNRSLRPWKRQSAHPEPNTTGAR